MKQWSLDARSRNRLPHPFVEASVFPSSGEGRRRAMGFLRLFVNYGLVAAILVATALVSVLAYRLEGSRWRWPMVALVFAGFGTVAGIFWIRRYVDKQTKASEQGSQR
jgi:MFS family permease